MNTNHAKAIKGMSIANIVLAALGVLAMLVVWAGLGAGGAAISGSGYDYFYTDDGYYITVDDMNMILGVAGVLVFLVLICAVLILIAGILGVRGANKPEKLKGVMIWNIVAAVVSLLSGCWVSLVLCIIVAVFASKDRKLYAAPVAAAPYGAPAYGYAPVPTAAPAASQQPAQTAPVTPQQPVQSAAVAPQQPIAAEAVVAAEPAIILPDSNVDHVMEGVTVIEAPEEPAAEPADDADKPTA
ncbi:hypothetical protein VJ923_06495 [Adlercreutzia sp. R25]|uniref:DUF4064 domain-containing protein n=1 Tax=Adlercreutzia shanghongiae TaxID=3111773 RepID=A0ABU6IZ24_9ACTN|nr:MULTISPECIES: hypothetical protein [unclassified Adlercreutzia]MEC4272803.1 hypothetical protein [Adlercreutzia sp. R25]MEC4295083.1 hypothetical protein [Adlercreutzia sp. R22]